MNYSNQEILQYFPFPEFRKGQQKIIERMNDSFNSGVKCILMSVPTGIGKSGINITFCRGTVSFYTTPINLLIDQILTDKYLGKYVVEIKGRNNYNCLKDYTGSTTVDSGMCLRYKNYIPTYCRKEVDCLYYSQKYKASNSPIVLTNPAYLILEGKIEEPSPPMLGVRDLLVVDEAHFIEDQIINVVQFELKPWILGLTIPEIKTKEELRVFIEQVNKNIQSQLADLEAQLDIHGNITITDVKMKNTLKDVYDKTNIFLDNYQHEWIWEKKFSTIQGKVHPYLKITPLHANLFGHLLWNKSTDKVIISSATLINMISYISDTGLLKKFKRDQILFLEAPSIFPIENRPIIDLSVGSLTMANLEANLEAACIKLEYILDMENGNVAVHVPSYALVEKILAMMRHIKTKHYHRFITHSGATRNDALEKWTTNRGNVFFAVAFTEGHDWRGDIVDAQVLFKVPYPDMGDKRIQRLLQLKRWDSYYARTLTTVIQAYGRAVRSETDKKRFYVLDSSFWSLLSRTKKILPAWFADVVPKVKNKN